VLEFPRRGSGPVLCPNPLQQDEADASPIANGTEYALSRQCGRAMRGGRTDWRKNCARGQRLYSTLPAGGRAGEDCRF